MLCYTDCGGTTAILQAVKFSLTEIAAATNGAVADVHSDVVIDGATQDSREISRDQLFIPLVADRDGHDFIDTAVTSGAGAYLTHRSPGSGAAVEVADTTAALRKLAQAARARIEGPVIAITGSVGKTSTKDLLAGALGDAFATHASTRSFNNEIGVPLTLINAPDTTHTAIIEMGARGIGHISTLCEIASPTVGIITTVAQAHTGEFGSVENIAIAKGELVEALPSSGLAVLNGDNPLVAAMSSRTSASVLTFGTNAGNDIHVRAVELDDELRATFTIATQWGDVVAQPATRGAHMATNVAAAVGTALWAGASIAQVEKGVAASTVSPWRMEVAHTASGALIINDSYNANPTSMRGALESLAALPHNRKIAVVGYMAELGASEGEDHQEIAQEIRDAGFELVAVGTELYGVDPVDPLAYLDELDDSTAVLVKGSRSAGLEKVAEALISGPG